MRAARPIKIFSASSMYGSLVAGACFLRGAHGEPVYLSLDFVGEGSAELLAIAGRAYSGPEGPKFSGPLFPADDFRLRRKTVIG